MHETHTMSAASPILLAFKAGVFTYGMTALGAASVIARRSPSRRSMDVMLGFSAGVMLAASFWSLLAPSLAIAEQSGQIPWLPPAAGFAAGGLGLWVLDKVMPHIHRIARGRPVEEGIHTRWRRTTLLVLAITLHNIPEGLALGVAFGAAVRGGEHASYGAALALTLGLGLQNLPEGLAVAGPLRREGWSRGRSFWYGQLSGVVEPLAAAVGAAVVGLSSAVLPYGLAFAAGAMIFVVIEELVPECQRCGHSDAAVLAALLGFTMMTVLDIALG